MTRGLLKPVLGWAAVAVLAVALTPARGQAPAGAERLCPGGSDAVLKKDKWTLVKQPEGLTKITAHAVSDRRQVMLASDGRTVVRSTDKGCSWKQVYSVATPSVEDTPIDGQLPEVAELLFIPESQTALMAIEGVGRAVAAQMLHSKEGGAEGSWTASTGLPQVNGYRDIVPAPDSGKVVYVTTGVNEAVGENDPAGSSGPLYASDDGGVTFRRMETAGGEISRLAVEPDTSGQYVWAVRSSGVVQKSLDYGATWETLVIPPNADVDPNAVPSTTAADKWRDIAVFKFAHLQHVVVVTAAPQKGADVTRAVISLTKGAAWNELPTDGLGPPGGLFFGAAQTQIYSTVPTDNTAYRGPGLLQYSLDEAEWVGLDNLGLTSLKDTRRVFEPTPQAPRFQTFWMRRDKPDPDAPDLLVRFEPDPPPEGNLTLLGRPPCGNPKASKLPDKLVNFEPGRLDLKLTPGQPARSPLKAMISADPTPLDIYFLMDHSSSMDPAIEGLNCSITRLVRELPRSNLDAHFGLGAYNDITRFTYRRLVDIEPPEKAGPDIAEALRTLYTLRGVDEPLRSALFQTATGAGHSRGVGVPPGQQANWRESSKVLRTVLVITDEPYEEDTNGEPEYAAVIDALKKKNVRVIGLRVLPFAGEQANPNDTDHAPHRMLLLDQQLKNIARDTGTLAPKGGVDCDGGGTPDVAEGQPIVCSIREEGIRAELDDTLVSVFRALAGEDKQKLRIVPRRTGGLQANVEGPEPEVDIRKENLLEGTAVLSCSEAQAGKRYDLVFDVMAGERVLGSIDGSAQCGELPAVVPPVVPPKAKPKPETPARPVEPRVVQPPEPLPAPAAPAAQAPQPAVAAAPPPPPPAPAPISSAPATSAVQAPVPQTGAAAQENKEVAVKAATVTTRDGEGPQAGREYAMVRVRRAEAVVPPEALITLSIGVSGLFVLVGWNAGTRRRRKREIEVARVDVRR